MNEQLKPILAEPDQRYWRRRANRRVRKARWSSRLRRWSLAAGALSIIGSALFQAGAHAVEQIKTQGGLTVEYIRIDGVERAGLRSVQELLVPYAGANIIDVNLYEVARAVERHPWVLEASAKRILPGTLHVSVIERRPAALARIDGVAYVVDTAGYVVGRHARGEDSDLPLLTGLDGLDDPQTEAAIVRGVEAVARLRATAGPWVGQVAEMDCSRPDRLVVRTVDAGPEILLDPQRVERNLNEYLQLGREIARHAGRLEYVDLRWRDRISVMPAARTVP